jgi:hypothetical protein
MKYFCLIILSIILKTGFGQTQTITIDCGIKKDYNKSTFKKFGRLRTFNFNSTYYNKKGLLCYVGDSTKKVTGYEGNWGGLEYFKKGRRAGRIVFYDQCATRVKEVHLFYPNRNNGKTSHLEFYENGKKKKKTITQNYKADKIVTWDANGKKTVEKIKRAGRQY